MLPRLLVAIAIILIFALIRPGHTAPLPVQVPTDEFPCPAGGSCIPPADSVVTNPIINCNHDPIPGGGGPSGIIVQNSNITIINPSIRECGSGVLVRKNPSTGAVPDNIRIIAQSGIAGYTATNIFLTRTGINVDRVTNLEVGDVSVPDSQVGGEFEIVDSYRPFAGSGGLNARLHHIKAYCQPNCSTFTGGSTNGPGAFWGFKWLADRSLGVPFEASEVEIDHNVVSDYEEEGISFDAHANDVPAAAVYGAGTITAKSVYSKRILTIPGIPTTESTVGMFITINDHQNLEVPMIQGQTWKIAARGTGSKVNEFTLVANEATSSEWGSIDPNVDRVSIGMRFFHNWVHNNRVTPIPLDDPGVETKVGIAFGGSVSFSRIAGNVINGDFIYNYPPEFHYRVISGTDSADQCIFVRSPARNLPVFSFQNSVVNNLCNAQGDVSSTVISQGGYEVDSPTWISGNTVQATFSNEWRYKSSEPLSDPWVP
jgi:hypothetical protein